MTFNDDKYEPVIGLEVHVQLATVSKLFCGCKTKFGLKPNSSTCPVCLGLPGSLPVLNRKAFRYTLKVALALNCDIQRVVKFDRKNYYYPDLPKNYQISQYDKPLAYNGYVELSSDAMRKIRVHRIHLEEDAGKLLHDQDSRYSVVDYNRTGTPLLEIVTEPEITSPEEAYEYLTSLKSVLEYLRVSDCNMEEGSLRCDANISVRKKGQKKLGIKSELKNMNSFKAVRSGLNYEIKRHIDVLRSGGTLFQETRLWDTDREMTLVMRTKEDTHDYRYFPEPDLVPFSIKDDDIKELRKDLPELPNKRKKRFIKQYGIGAKEASILTSSINIAEYYDLTLKYCNEPKMVYNWLTGDILSELNQKNILIEKYGLSPEMLAELIALIRDGRISGKMGKSILRESAETGKSPGKIVEEKGLKQISDQSELAAVVGDVIRDNTKSVDDYKKGKKNALMFLVGQVMRRTKGKANPGIVNDLLREKLE